MLIIAVLLKEIKSLDVVCSSWKALEKNLQTKYYTESLLQHSANNLKVWENTLPLQIPAISEDFVIRKK